MHGQNPIKPVTVGRECFCAMYEKTPW